MKFKASIDIMPLRELLRPQGKTAARNMHYVHVTGVDSVRIGKHIEMVLEALDREEAAEKVELACKKLPANVIMEISTFELEPEQLS